MAHNPDNPKKADPLPAFQHLIGSCLIASSSWSGLENEPLNRSSSRELHDFGEPLKRRQLEQHKATTLELSQVINESGTTQRTGFNLVTVSTVILTNVSTSSKTKESTDRNKFTCHPHLNSSYEPYWSFGHRNHFWFRGVPILTFSA